MGKGSDDRTAIAVAIASSSDVRLSGEQLRQVISEIREAIAGPPNPPFGQVAERWLSTLRRVDGNNERRHLRHLGPLFEMTDRELTPRAARACLEGLLRPEGPLSAATANKVRSTGKLVVEFAQSDGQWRGPNPFATVKRFKESQRLYVTLTRAEALRVVPHVTPRLRALVAFCLLTGVRPGEAIGLHKTDVDFRRGSVWIHRSHGRAATKTGKERRIPLPREVTGLVRQSMRESRGPYVFSSPDGSRIKRWRLSRRLRAALVRAGLVEGYSHHCNKKGCGFVEQTKQRLRRACPKCGRRLLQVPRPKNVRFYDLRHTTATLAHKAGVNSLAKKLVLGHSVQGVTDGIYTHLDEAFIGREWKKLEKQLTPVHGRSTKK